MPRPPCPPAAASQRSPAVTRSASTSPVERRHHRALGHGDDEVVPAGPVALLALPVGAVLGPAVRVVPEGEQRRHVAVGDEPDVAAVAAVAAVGPALGDVGLPAERHAAGAAVAAPDVHAHLVDELTDTTESASASGASCSLRDAAAQVEPDGRYSLTRWTGSPLMAADQVVVSAGEPAGLAPRS